MGAKYQRIRAVDFRKASPMRQKLPAVEMHRLP
jgi:hypothetical protein